MGHEPRSVPQSESELEQFFDLSLDLLCIAGLDGFFKRVNPALERTFGYARAELLSRPFLEFVHPDDAQSCRDVLGELERGNDVIGFEHRIICGDGSVRWLEWRTRTMPERGVVYGAATDVTDRRSADDELRGRAEEQAALRRVATLVARASSPMQVFAAVAEEAGQLPRVDHAAVVRYEPDETATFVGPLSPIDADAPGGIEGNVVARVRETGRPARIEDVAVGAPIVVEGRLWGAMIVLSRGAEPLPAGTEARIEQFTELVATAISNIEARSELAASRARIVAATDAERRRVVRDLHDGAQQRLAHAIVTLKLACEALEDEEDDGPALVTEALGNAQRATDELREIAHGILPGVLTHGGLRAGVDALASRMPVPVENSVAVGRLPDAVEANAYFVVAEALANVARHARAQHAAVTARVEHGMLAVDVRDDGVGGARPDGSGLVRLADRLAAIEGRLEVESPPEGGTLVAAAIPLAGSAPEPGR